MIIPVPKPIKGQRLIERQGGKDPKYLEAVKQLPCCICLRDGPSDAHHTFCGRFSRAKTSDREAIPLCKQCHQWGPLAIHNGKESWVERNGPDTDYIAPTQAAVERMMK